MQELDDRCEELIKEKFGLLCNFEEEDAIQKLDKLEIITRVNFSFFLNIIPSELCQFYTINTFNKKSTKEIKK